MDRRVKPGDDNPEDETNGVATAARPSTPLRPHHLRRQAHEDGVDVAAGLQAEEGAAVVEQVELDVAAAPDQLAAALLRRPRRIHVAANDARIDIEEGAADVAREGEVGVPVAAIEIVVEDA